MLAETTSRHTAHAAARISDEDIAAYERDGAVIIRSAISKDWIERLRKAVDDILARPGAFASENAAPTDKGRFYGELFVWRHSPAIAEFLFQSPLAELAGRIMRAARVNFFYDQLLVKEPGTGASRTPWHQDLPYWPIKGWQIASIWVPLDRATPENGVVTYVKGSHLWGKFYQPRPFGPAAPNRSYEDAGLEEAPDIDARPWDFEFVTGVLEPGDVFVHHARTLHGAPGNASSHMRRRALATRWTGDDVVWDDRPGAFMRAEKYKALRSEVTLQNGEPLGGTLFPKVWPRSR